MMSMKFDYDIAIAGGGLNGPALALCLAQNGLRVGLIDAQPIGARAQSGFDGRSYALAHASMRLLSVLGVWQKLHKHAQPIEQIKASDGQAGKGTSPFFLHFNSSELEEGMMGYIVEERHLYSALINSALEHQNIDILSEQLITGQVLSQESAEILLASGKSISCEVLIGCDGRRSSIAKRAGIGRFGWDYGQSAQVCAVHHDKHHQGIAHQFFMPAGPLAILPLADGHRSSIVWCESHARAKMISIMSDEEYLKTLRPCFGDFLGKVSLAGGRFSYPLSLSLTESFVRPRLALVGDAAHGVHPIAGQGLNLGLRDVAALAEVLVKARRRGEDMGMMNVLERYQEWRRFDTTALALSMDMVNRVFSNNNPLLRLTRDIGMGFVSSVAPLRQRFMRQAAGLSGNLPRLMMGQNI